MNDFRSNDPFGVAVEAQLPAILKSREGEQIPEKSVAECLIPTLLTSNQLRDLKIPKRPDLLGGWLCEGDYGLIIAERGVGKTWFSLMVAHAVAGNTSLGPWECGEIKGRVLYIDGEMPLDLIQSRDVGLSKGKESDLVYLHHEQVFDATEKSLNLSSPEIRNAITDICLTQNRNVVVLDNLSTLVAGIRENDSFDWEHIQAWLLELRRRKITLILVHHAGRNGLGRGTTKREDPASWVVSLTDAKDGGAGGARFVSHFSKPSRNAPDGVADQEWSIETAQDGTISVECGAAESKDRFRQAIENGFTKNGEIAQHLNLQKAHVSKLAKKGMDAGWLVKGEHGDYTIVQS